MKKNTSFIAMCVALVAAIAGCGKTDSNAEILERNDVRLAIPREYITKEKWPPWIWSASGLDSSEGSALLRIPIDELKGIVPRNSPEPADSSALIQILSNGEIKRATQVRREQIENINANREQYSRSKIVIDPSSGFYRLYDSYNQGTVNTTSKWEVVAKAPPLGPDDLIATCIRHEMSVITICELSAFVFDGVVVQMSIREEHLPYYERFKEHMISRLRSWRVASKSAP